MRRRATGRLWLGGQSYGGRQASILAAGEAGLVDALLLLSYPLHPPGKSGERRTAHFPELRTPALFVHGSADPFGTLDEVESARARRRLRRRSPRPSSTSPPSSEERRRAEPRGVDLATRSGGVRLPRARPPDLVHELGEAREVRRLQIDEREHVAVLLGSREHRVDREGRPPVGEGQERLRRRAGAHPGAGGGL